MDQTKKLVNKIPDYNDKAIRIGNRIIDKSGQATNILRKTAGITSSITNGIANLGGDVPVVGSLLKAGAGATKMLSKGANKLDNARDKAANKLNKYEQVSKETINDIEKQNQRKRIAEIQANDMDDGFA